MGVGNVAQNELIPTAPHALCFKVTCGGLHSGSQYALVACHFS